MGDIFLKLLNMSITATWLIIAVTCIRLIFRKIPKWVNCILWGVVAVRLICPFSIESSFSILSSAEPIRSDTIVRGEVQNYIPSIDSNLPIVENTINPMLTEAFAYREEESAAPLQVAVGIAGIVQICGMILLMAYAVGSMIRLHKLVRESVCYRDNIYICDAVRSPFILGVIRPKIYLSSALCEDKMNYIIAHELAHLKRKDHWWKPLGYLLLCVYWFNPFCWAAYMMLCKDIEMACDEKVIRDMTFLEKKEYSKVLLSCTQQRHLVMACPLAFGEVGVKERVRSVLNYKKPAFWMIIVAAVICVIMVICFLTDPADKSKDITADPAAVGSTVLEGDPGNDQFSDHVSSNEAVTQEEVFSDVMAANILTDSGPVAVSKEDAAILRAYIEGGVWNEGTADCLNNCELTLPTETIQYHSDCGTYNDPANSRHLSLDEKDRVKVNKILAKYVSLESTEEPLEKNFAPESSEVMEITVTNGYNGEEMTFSRADSNNAFGNLLRLYELLNFSAETEEVSRSGYRYFMTLSNAEGEIIHVVTPYKDGFSMDDTFYKYSGTDGCDGASVNLMNYMDLLFYPADEDERLEPLDEKEKMEKTIGMQVVLPDNSSWIKDISYDYKSDHAMEIQYYDGILEEDCTLQIVRDGTLELPDISFDSRQEESWQGTSASDQWVLIKVQRSEDGKHALVIWEYGDCKFAIQAAVSDGDADISSIPKTAIDIIENLE